MTPIPLMPEPDLFISYNRLADEALALQMQRLVERVGLPLWKWKRRSVFLDVDGMTATADAQKQLIETLRSSQHLTLLACPSSAQSDWVQCELAAWLTNFKHFNWTPKTGPFPLLDVDPDRVERLFICHTGGTLARAVDAPDFDWLLTDALPQHLKGVFPTNPGWQNLKSLQDGSVKKDALLISCAALAGAMSDPKKTPAEILARDRKFLIGLTSAAVMAAVALLVLGAIAGYQWRAAALAQKQAEIEFQNAKKIVDENFTKVAYDMKDLPGAGPLRFDLMKKAAQYYTEFLNRRRNDALDEDMDVALANLGLIKLELGQEAGPQFQTGVDFLAERAARQPDDVEIQRAWAQSIYNVGVAALGQERYAEAEPRIREVIALQDKLRKKFPSDRHLELDYWNSHLGLAAAVAHQSRDRAKEAEDLTAKAKAGLSQLIETLAKDPESRLRAVITEMAREHLAGAFLNLANSDSLPLAERRRFGEQAWLAWEDLTQQQPTNHQRFYRTAQACRLMADLWKKSGDDGDAQVFAERSLLIHRKLAQQFTGNDIFKKEYQQDLRFLLTIGPWKQDTWFHEAARNALVSTYELKLGELSEQRELAHRIALANVQIASGLLRSYFAAEPQASSPEDKAKARTHLLEAKKYSDLSRAGVAPTEVPKSHIVMELNIPMWSELAQQ